ncbi:ENTH/VHS family protein, putative isoform 2 [Hibiscus syriacus]|uniref:ENTH/VHS family protein, putative isoform 2 n=1 Tax=Hibiscus syriacus TaxID=106335 RepID=A0A6A3CNN9_HIBSY|nr:ENTH/VHS family protein, putative isoform 2 [Hibiscus syriacus]
MTLQVPDQKLPSLYLLDSIVKNIGRDYIKHFAARLPEKTMFSMKTLHPSTNIHIQLPPLCAQDLKLFQMLKSSLYVFCKAYRPVDPHVHQSMRHLFGTWKGVFPLPTLQVIEKELGFSPVINGSSSGTIASRPDTLSQCPPHSIHVNPKYLERQRHQQSSRQYVIDLMPYYTGFSIVLLLCDEGKGMVNDMTGTLANAKEDYERPDRAAITAGRPYGDPSVKMNNIGVTFGAYDYGFDLSQTNGGGVGRASVTEAIPSQRNGFNIKHGSQNYPASKSGNADPRLLARQNISANVSINSRKDPWTIDASEKLDFESPFCKAQSINDVGSGFDRKTSSDSLSTELKEKPSYGFRISSAWPLQESHKTDGLPAFSSSHSATIGGLPPAARSSLARIEKRPQIGSSHLEQQRFQSMGTASPPDQSPLRQHSPSPSFPSRHTHQQLQNFVEPQTHSRPPSDPNLSKFSGKLDVGSLKHSHQVSSALTSRSSYLYSLSQPPKPDHVQVESSGQTQKSLLSQSSEHSFPSGSLPAIFTSSGSASHDPIATTTNSLQVKVDQPSSVVSNAPLQTSDPERKASIPVSNLLSSLVAKGLISASKHASSPSPASVPTSCDAPRSSTMVEISFAEPATKVSVALHQSSSVEVENVIGLEFRPDVIREFHSSVMSGLLDNLPYCCSLYGLQLKLQERLNRHLEWHTMKKAEPKGSDIALRGWYALSDDWIAGKPVQLVSESTKPVNQSDMTADKVEVTVPADEEQYACMLCCQIFEDFFSQERGEWMFKGAVYLTIPLQEDGQGGST